MPDIDRTAEIKVTAAQGTVTAEIPLAGHASDHWLTLFRKLVSQRKQDPRPEAEQRVDRAWVIVRLPAASTDLHPEPVLDAVRDLISEANRMEQQSLSGAPHTEAAIRGWWARQQR
ncbi:MAG: hypothetical protein ACRDOK_27575 [Streptosporangiaceae bacterium]